MTTTKRWTATLTARSSIAHGGETRGTITLLEVLSTAGDWDHAAPVGPLPDLHEILIAQPAAAAHASFGPGELWGVRADESRGRAALYRRALRDEQLRPAGTHRGPVAASHERHGGVVRRADGTVAFGPIWNWSTADVWGYLGRNGVPANPIYRKLRRLGVPERAQRVSHVLDGNLLELGRATWLRRGWPDLSAQLDQVLPRLREFV